MGSESLWYHEEKLGNGLSPKETETVMCESQELNHRPER